MSFSSSDDDSQQRFALGFLFALIALVVSIVVGTGSTNGEFPTRRSPQQQRQRRQQLPRSQSSPRMWPVCAWRAAW